MERVRYLGRRKGRRPAMHAAMVVALGFLIIILTGAVLLTLPISARSGEPTDFQPKPINPWKTKPIKIKEMRYLSWKNYWKFWKQFSPT